MDQETKFFRNKSKTVKLLMTSGLVCVVLLFVLLYAIGLFDGVLKVKVAVFSGGALLVMLFLLLNSLFNLRDKTAQIVLNKTSFLGKTTPLAKAFGAGNWTDVTAITLEKVGGDTLVIVTLGHANQYKERLSSILWKMAYHAPTDELNIMYSASVIEIDAAELYELFMSYWKDSKSSVITG